MVSVDVNRHVYLLTSASLQNIPTMSKFKTHLKTVLVERLLHEPRQTIYVTIDYLYVYVYIWASPTVSMCRAKVRHVPSDSLRGGGSHHFLCA